MCLEAFYEGCSKFFARQFSCFLCFAFAFWDQLSYYVGSLTMCSWSSCLTLLGVGLWCPPPSKTILIVIVSMLASVGYLLLPSWKLLWFGATVSPTGSCVGGWVPAGRWGLWEVLQEGSDSVNGLICWCIHNWMALWEAMETGKCPRPHTPTIVRFFSIAQGCYLQVYLVD